jgi:excisionase family DNA binding protein
MNDRLLTVDEAAQIMNTTPRFIRRLIAERRICFHHLGRHVRILESDVDAFVAAGRVNTADSAPTSRHSTAGVR